MMNECDPDFLTCSDCGLVMPIGGSNSCRGCMNDLCDCCATAGDGACSLCVRAANEEKIELYDAIVKERDQLKLQITDIREECFDEKEALVRVIQRIAQGRELAEEAAENYHAAWLDACVYWKGSRDEAREMILTIGLLLRAWVTRDRAGWTPGPIMDIYAMIDSCPWVNGESD